MPLLLIGVILALMIAGSILDDRMHHADGAGDQERHPAGRFRQSEALARAGTGCRAGQRRRGAVPADHHDDARNDLRDDSPWPSPLRAAAHSVHRWAHVVIGGLISSTTLALDVMPVILSYRQRPGSSGLARRKRLMITSMSRVGCSPAPQTVPLLRIGTAQNPTRPCPCPGPNSTRPCRPRHSRSPSSGPAGWRAEAGRVRFRAAAGQRCTVVRRRPLPCYSVPADAAASIRAMSIFRIVIIASIARLALARSGSVVSSISRFGVICQE